MTSPLAAIRVVDVTVELGELCGRVLADFGAEVVRVEPPGGSPSRQRELWFAYRNANKRSVTGDAETVRALVRDADVLLENGGLGFDAIAENPQLVWTTISPFGSSGPYAGYVTTNLVSLAMGGMLHHSGWADREPLAQPGSPGDDAPGIMAAFATLSALWSRRRTGRGQHIDLSAMASLAQLGDWGLPNGSVNGFAGGQGGRGGSGPVYPLYPCADGYVRVVILSRRQWRAMREWMGEPDVLQDDKWDALMTRLGGMDVLEPLYLEFFGRYKKSDLAAEAQRRGIPITPVLTPQEVLDNEHYASRGTFVRTEIARGVTGTVPSGFVELDGVRHGLRTRAPEAGEHDTSPWLSSRTPVDGAAPEQRVLPFEGLRVLDFGIGGVGVEAARLFAEYGADVIKVESRTYPDFIRSLYGTEMTASFASSSRSKRSIGVNCKTAEGRAIVHRLVQHADALIENSHTGTMATLGCDYETLKGINPRLVMLSSQLMGSHGVWSSWTGYGPSTRPAGGLTHLWNYEDGDMPPGSRSIYPDHLAGRLCATVAVAGLLGGTGVHAEVAQVEAVIGLLGDLYLQESVAPASVVPVGNASGRGAPWGVYRCAGTERWCAITVRDDADWQRLVGATGIDNHAERATTAGRLAARAAIDGELEAWTLQRSDREVMETLQATGVPAGMMLYPVDQASDPHLVALGFPVRVEQPGVGPMLFEGAAFSASGMPDAVVRPAPGLGEHTREICRDLLGMDDAEIDRLARAGVLELELATA